MSWKKYGGLKNLDSNNNIAVNSLVTDTFTIRDKILTEFQVIGDTQLLGNIILGIVDSNNNITQTVTSNAHIVTIGNIDVSGNVSVGNKLFMTSSIDGVFIKGVDSGKLGVNTTSPTAILDISGSYEEILNVQSQLASNRNIIARNNTDDGIAVVTTDASSAIQFYNSGGITDKSNPDAEIKYTNNGILEIITDTDTRIFSSITISDDGRSGHLNNETMVIYDISDGTYRNLYYKEGTIHKGNAITVVSTDASSNTSINIITPSGEGGIITGGVYPGDITKSMLVMDVSNNSQIKAPAQMIVAGTNIEKYNTTTSFNKFVSQVDKYVVDINGATNITDNQTTIVEEPNKEILKMGFHGEYGYAVGTVDSDNKYMLYKTENGGITWIQEEFVYGNDNDTLSGDKYSFVDIYINENTVSLVVFFNGDSGDGSFLFTTPGKQNSSDTYGNFSTRTKLDYDGDAVECVYSFADTDSYNHFIISRSAHIVLLSSNDSIEDIIYNNVNPVKDIDGNGNVIFCVGNDNITKYTLDTQFDDVTTPTVYANGVFTINMTYNSSFNINYKTVSVYNHIIIAAGDSGLSCSKDNGANWTDVSIPNLNANDIFIKSELHAIVVGEGGNIYTTHDGFKTWNKADDLYFNGSGISKFVLADTLNNITSVHMPNNNTIITSHVNKQTIFDGIVATSFGESKLIHTYTPSLFNRNNTSVLDVVGTISVSGDLMFHDRGELKTTDASFGLLKTGTTEINFGLSGEIITMGSKTGLVDINGRLQVTDDVSFNSDLDVYGNTSIIGLLDVSNAVHFGNQLNLDGSANFTENLNISGDIILSNNAEIKTTDTTFGLLKTVATTIDFGLSGELINIGSKIGLVDMNGRLQVAEDVSFNSDFDVYGNTSIIGLLDVSNAVHFGNQLNLDGSANFTENLNISGDIILSNNAEIKTTDASFGLLKTGATTIEFGLSGELINIGAESGLIYMNGHLQVADDVSFNSDLDVYRNTSIIGLLDVSNAVHFGNQLNLDGSANFTENLNISGDIILSNNSEIKTTDASFGLLKTGATTIEFGLSGELINIGSKIGLVDINGRLQVAEDVSFNSDLDVSGNTSIIGLLDVSNAVHFGNQLNLDGSANFTENLNISGDIILSNNAEIKTTDTTFGLLKTVATTIDFGLSGELINIGAESGLVDMNGRLQVADDVSLNSNIDISGNTSMVGLLDVDSDVHFRSQLNLDGSANFTENLNISGDIIFSNNAEIKTTDASFGLLKTVATTIDFGLSGELINIGSKIGLVDMNGRLQVADDVSLNSNIDISGNTSMVGLLDVDSDVHFRSQLNLDGSANFTENLNISGDIIFSNNAEIKTTDASFGLLKTVATTIDFGLSGELINIGAESGLIYMNGHLQVADDVSFNSDLDVTGNTSMVGLLEVDSDVHFKKQLNLDGSANFTENLNISGDIIFSNNAEIKTTDASFGLLKTVATTIDFGLSGELINIGSKIGLVDINGRLQVAEDVSFNSDFDVYGNTSIVGLLDVSSAVHFGNQLNLDGSANFAENLNISGDIIFSNNAEIKTTDASFGLLKTGATTIEFGLSGELINIGAESGLIYMNGHLQVADDVSFNSDLDVTGNTSMVGLLEVDSDVHFKKQLNLDGSANFAENLNISGDIILSNNARIVTTNAIFGLLETVATTINFGLAGETINVGAENGLVDMNGRLRVADDVSFNSDLDVTGNTSMVGLLEVDSDVHFGNQLNLDGSANFSENLNISGDIILSNNARIVTTNAIFGLLETVATTINFGLAGETINVGAENGLVDMNGRLRVADDVSLNSDLAVSGNTTMVGLLEVDSDVYFKKQLNLDGSANFTENLNISGDIILSNNSGIKTTDTIFGLLETVATTINFGLAGETINVGASTSDVIMNDKLHVKGSLIVDGSINFAGDLVQTDIQHTVLMSDQLRINNVGGDDIALVVNQLVNAKIVDFKKADVSKFSIESDGKVTATENASFIKEVSIGGNVIITSTGDANEDNDTNGALIVVGQSKFKDNVIMMGDIYVKGKFKVDGTLTTIAPITAEGAITASKFIATVSTAAEFSSGTGSIVTNGGIFVRKNVLAEQNIETLESVISHGDISGGNTFNLHGDAFLNSNLFVVGDISGNSNLFVYGNTSLNSTLFVEGDISGNANLFIGGDASLNSTLFVEGDISGNSNLFVGGDASLNSALFVEGDISGNSNLFIGGDASLNSALLVEGDISGNSSLSIGGKVTSVGDITGNSNLFIGGDASLNAKLLVEGDISGNSNLFVGGDASLNAKLFVEGDISGNSNLFIGGDASLHSALFVEGDISGNSNLFIGGDASLHSALFVEGDISGNANLFIGGDASLNSALFVESDISGNSNLFIGGDASLHSALFVESDISGNSNLFVGGDASLNSALFVEGDISGNSSLSIGGKVTSVGDITGNSNLFIGGDASLNAKLFVEGDISGNSNLFVGGDASLNAKLFVEGDISGNSNLYLTGDASLNSDVFIAGDISANTNLFLGGDAYLNSKLFVSGDTSLNSNVFIAGDISGNSNLFIGGDASLNSNVFIAGDISGNSNLFIGGDASLNSKLFVSGDLTVSNSNEIFYKNMTLDDRFFKNMTFFTAQYIRFEKTGSVINLAEIKVYNLDGVQYDTSGWDVSMSSVYSSGFNEDKIIDGSDGTFLVTNSSTNGWVEIDMKKTLNFKYFTLVNRTGTLGGRTVGVSMIMKDGDGNELDDSLVTEDNDAYDYRGASVRREITADLTDYTWRHIIPDGDLLVDGNAVIWGNVICSTTPTDDTHLTNKFYVDDVVGDLSTNFYDLSGVVDLKLDLTGGTISNDLTIDGILTYDDAKSGTTGQIYVDNISNSTALVGGKWFRIMTGGNDIGGTLIFNLRQGLVYSYVEIRFANQFWVESSLRVINQGVYSNSGFSKIRIQSATTGFLGTVIDVYIDDNINANSLTVNLKDCYSNPYGLVDFTRDPTPLNGGVNIKTLELDLTTTTFGGVRADQAGDVISDFRFSRTGLLTVSSADITGDLNVDGSLNLTGAITRNAKELLSAYDNVLRFNEGNGFSLTKITGVVEITGGVSFDGGRTLSAELNTLQTGKLDLTGGTMTGGLALSGTAKLKMVSDNSYGSDHYIYANWSGANNDHSIGTEYEYYTGSGGEGTTHSRINFVSNSINNEDIDGSGKQTMMSVLSNGRVEIGGNLEVGGNVISSTTPTDDTHLTNKFYVDGVVHDLSGVVHDLSSNFYELETVVHDLSGVVDLKLTKTGDTMTGDLTVSNPNEINYKDMPLDSRFFKNTHFFTAQYIRFDGRDSIINLAEIKVFDFDGNEYDKTGWVVTADSVLGGFSLGNFIDGDDVSFIHTNANYGFVEVNMGSVLNFTHFTLVNRVNAANSQARAVGVAMLLKDGDGNVLDDRFVTEDNNAYDYISGSPRRLITTARTDYTWRHTPDLEVVVDLNVSNYKEINYKNMTLDNRFFLNRTFFSARYIRFERIAQYINLAELRVYALDGSEYSKTDWVVTLSDQLSSFAPEHLIDGIESTFAHTNDDNGWIEVDMRANLDFKYFNLVNRNNSVDSMNQTIGVSVILKDSDGIELEDSFITEDNDAYDYISGSARRQITTALYDYTFRHTIPTLNDLVIDGEINYKDMTLDDRFFINSGSFKARYIRFTRTGKYINLAEIKVYALDGVQYDTSGWDVSMSSQYEDDVPENIIDENDITYLHTLNSNEWVEIDMASTREFKYFTLVNRNDFISTRDRIIGLSMIMKDGDGNELDDRFVTEDNDAYDYVGSSVRQQIIIGRADYTFRYSTPRGDLGVDGEIKFDGGRTLSTELNTAESNIGTLQTEMDTAETNIGTLQTEMDTAETNIDTLQTDLNTAESAIVTLQSGKLNLTGGTMTGGLELSGTAKLKMVTSNFYNSDHYIYANWSGANNDHSIGTEYNYYTGSGGEGTTHSRINFVSNSINNEDINGSGKQTMMSVLSNGRVGIGTSQPTEKLEVYGNVKATYFKGDGSELTNLPVITDSSKANKESPTFTGNVVIGGSSAPDTTLRVAKSSPYIHSGSNVGTLHVVGEAISSRANTNSQDIIVLEQPNVVVGSKGSKMAIALSFFEDPNNNFPRTRADFKLTGRVTDSTTTPMTVMSLFDTGNVQISGTISATSFTGSGSGLTGTATSLNIGGNAHSATKLYTSRNIGGVSFDGQNNIDLPGVNIEGNQDTIGNAATATKVKVTVSGSNIAYYPVFVSGNSTENKGILVDGGLTYNPNTNMLSATSFNATSDIRVKRQIEDIVPKTALTKVTQLTPRTYTFIDQDRRHHGLIAQELEQIIPEAVSSCGTSFIPSIYESCLLINDGTTIVLDIKTVSDISGSKLQVTDSSGNKQTVNVKETNADKQIHLDTDARQHAVKHEDGTYRIFVFGHNVSDFRSVNYNQLVAINLAATKELNSQLKDTQTQLKDTQTQLKDTQTQLNELRITVELLLNR
jgi:predicted small secreted protein